MTHYLVDYAELGIGTNAAHAKALADIKDYMGEDRYNLVTLEFKKMPVMPTLDQMHYWLMLAGISGYPVQAWQSECWPYG